MPQRSVKVAEKLPIDSPERRRLPVLLRRAWYGLNLAFRRRILHLKLTPDQFTVMRTLLETEGITQRKLSQTMSSDPNTIAALLERMEASGLIDRQTHEKDRRANRLRVTSIGRKKYESARATAIEMQREVLAGLEASQREIFLANLDTVAQSCRLMAEKPSIRARK